MRIVLDDNKFLRDMKNIFAYSEGFLDGAAFGKAALLTSLGAKIKELAYQYVDASARVNPQSLHHVYEWYMAGEANARLFKFSYTVTGLGITFSSEFTQSQTVAMNSSRPFVNKAEIMERGRSVTIRPIKAEKLVFEVDGETVFSEGPITIDNPGGDQVVGAFDRIVDEFFNKYLAQSFLYASGLLNHLKTADDYDKYLAAGKLRGRAVGLQAGKRWVVGEI